MRVRIPFGVAVLAFTVSFDTGCAPTTSRRQSDTGLGSTTVSATALRGQDGSLYDALTRLRPWIIARRGGQQVFVSIDGSPLTDAAILKSIRASTVYEVRLRRASSSVGHAAASPTGAVIFGDVVEVTTREPPRRGDPDA